jgi:hypothetical protein
MIPLRAIETVYKGYRFRSRLEARWAVFFDTLGIKYEYEAQGFDLGKSGYYLPDFWLPREEVWVEIKGTPPPVSDVHKMHSLCLGGRPVLCLIGQPYQGEYFGCIASMDIGGFQSITEIARCRKCDALNWLDERAPSWGSLGRCCPTDKHPAPEFDEALHAAYQAARQARFEHGETPR